MEVGEFFDLGFHLLFGEARDGIIGVSLGEFGQEKPLHYVVGIDED
jgi:hypothetical protein